MSDRTALHEAKLRALVRDAGHGEIDCIESPGDAGGFVASRGFVLVDGLEPARAVRALGPALLWATKHGFETLSILASHDVAGHVARRAGALGGGEMRARGSFGPLVDVLAVSGRQLATADPAPIAEVPVLGPRVWAMAGVISEAGARPVDDHGRLVAEFAGLEVARVVEHGAEVVLEVGVGQADRELQQLVHGTLDPDAALRRAIAAVAVHRHGAAPPHPLNRLARERWLRSALLDRPSSIDLATLDPVPPLRPATRCSAASRWPPSVPMLRVDPSSWSARWASRSIWPPRPATIACAPIPTHASSWWSRPEIAIPSSNA